MSALYELAARGVVVAAVAAALILGLLWWRDGRSVRRELSPRDDD